LIFIPKEEHRKALALGTTESLQRSLLHLQGRKWVEEGQKYNLEWMLV
jgi:hypothetical protein